VDALLEDELNVGTFNSTEEELIFWKERYGIISAALKETRHALDEFQAESRDYEEELEHNLEVMEAQNKELRGIVSVLQLELEHWKRKYQDDRLDSNEQIASLQREFEYLRQQQNSFKERTRALELDNDDLERHGREAECSRRDLEVKLSSVMERNTYLEQEFEVKQKLVVVVQRLKDELRDLQLELSVLKSRRASFKRRSVSGVISSPSLAQGMDENSPMIMQSMGGSSGVASISSPQRTNPVQLVQEMLGRVKTLETRLVNCRNLVNPLLQPPPSYQSLHSARTPHHASKGGTNTNTNTTLTTTTPNNTSTATSVVMERKIRAMSEARPRGMSESASKCVMTAEEAKVMLMERARLRKKRLEEMEKVKRRRGEGHE